MTNHPMTTRTRTRTTKTKQRRIKARKEYVFPLGKDAIELWSLPADRDSVERMVEQMARAIDPEAWTMCDSFEQRMRCGDPTPWLDYRMENRQKARAALAAIGLTAKEGK